MDAATEQCEWNNAGNTAASRYVLDFAQEHIRHGWSVDWSSDEHAIAHWLGDFPYDDIVAAAGSFLGLEKLTQLAAKAEGGDKWEYAKLAAATSMCARKEAGIELALEWERKSMDALGELDSDEATERSDDHDRLELEVGLRILGGFGPADLQKYLARTSHPLCFFRSNLKSSPCHVQACWKSATGLSRISTSSTRQWRSSSRHRS